jgi:hypothetical protein
VSIIVRDTTQIEYQDSAHKYHCTCESIGIEEWVSKRHRQRDILYFGL